jgi:serine protease Do
MKMNPNIAWIIAVVALAMAASGIVYEHEEIKGLSYSVTSLQNTVFDLASTTESVGEIARSAEIVQKSQGQQLQDAVAKVTPAVVSIVESQVVPKLQVTYENPFGNDPFFQGFNVQVPVYQQVGTQTQQVAAGTGFIVRSTGYIITNKHVVPDTNATYTVLLANGKQVSGTVVWRSSTEDLAVLKISGSGYPTVALSDSSTLTLGQSVFAVGNALGQYSNSVSVGVISGLNRSISASDENGNSETLNGVIQTDAAVNPGNSGGPLVDLSGDAVGVNVAMVQGSENIGFSLPIKEVTTAVANLGI